MTRTIHILIVLGILSVCVLCAQTQEVAPGTGSITGQVMDAQNTPIAGARVVLLKLIIKNGYDPLKTRIERSDATGAYGFKNVEPGDYWVAVEPEVQTDPNGRITRFYFPDTMSGKDAYALRVGPNAVLTTIDVRCIPVKQGFEARGRVLESASGKPLTNMRLTYGQLNNGFIRQDVQTNQQGHFVITRLDPGKYWVALLHEQSGAYYSYPAYFEITTADIPDILVSAYTGVSLKGKVLLDKGIPDTLFSELNVVFHPNGISEVNEHPTSYIIDRYMEKSSPVSVDGNFVIKGAPPLIGKLSLQRRAGLPLEKHYVRIEQNGINISNALRIRKEDVAGIAIHVSAGTGKITGSVSARNVIVDLRRIRVLVSLQNAPGATFATSMPLDDSGRFAFDGLLPGEYRVMAAISDSNGMSRRSGDIYTVHVAEGETQEIEILLNEK